MREESQLIEGRSMRSLRSFAALRMTGSRVLRTSAFLSPKKCEIREKQDGGNLSPQSVPLTKRKYVLPFILITSLFFLWAFGVNLNDVLIPHFKSAFSLSDFQSSFIQVAFFGGYFLAALVAGRLMERTGYRRGILSGLFLCAAGAILFVPAGSLGIYGLFLLSSFVLACGQSFLEVAANPYSTILGPPESSERRLN